MLFTKDNFLFTPSLIADNTYVLPSTTRSNPGAEPGLILDHSQISIHMHTHPSLYLREQGRVGM